MSTAAPTAIASIVIIAALAAALIWATTTPRLETFADAADAAPVNWWPPLPPGIPVPISTATETTQTYDTKRPPTDANPWMNPMPGEPAKYRFGTGAAKPSTAGGLPIFRRNFSDKIYKTEAQLYDPNRWAEQHHFYTMPGAGAQVADAATILNRGRFIPSGIPRTRPFVTL